MRICHVTSVHPLDDVRIVRKQVRTLVQAGYEVSVVGTEGRTDYSSGARFVQVRRKGDGRLARMTTHAFRVIRAALEVRATLYHLHDPELLPWAFMLRRSGARIVYDAHEDLAAQIRGKPYLAPSLRPALSRASDLAIRGLTAITDSVVSATPEIGRRFVRERDVVVCNYPSHEEFGVVPGLKYTLRPYRVAYVGGISADRGIMELVEAVGCQRRPVRLDLLGCFFGANLEARLRFLDGWERTDFHGWLDRPGVAHVLSRVRAGVVTLHPTPAYQKSLPVKLFEYMMAGLPVIASDFPLWRGIVGEVECGLLVDPESPQAIAEAIDWIIEHPEEACAMGERGRRAVVETLNWENEAKKLIALYERLLA